MNQPKPTEPKMASLLEDVLETLDELHTLASEGDAQTSTGMTRRELVSLLREMVFTAEETIRELQAQSSAQTPILRLVDKEESIEKVG
jgi:DNA-binding response OmpR family regulator